MWDHPTAVQATLYRLSCVNCGILLGFSMDRLEGRVSEVRKGSWTQEEDELLRKCIENHGEGKWHQVPQLAGLNRCRKSCRLRWLNYLSPNIIRGKFSADEVDYILRLHKLLGNRWSLIAGRLPGRTANDVKNYWNTHLQKKMISPGKLKEHEPQAVITKSNILFRPQPRTFSKRILEKPSIQFNCTTYNNNAPMQQNHLYQSSAAAPVTTEDDDGEMQWWENLINADELLEVNLASSPTSCWFDADFASNMFRI